MAVPLFELFLGLLAVYLVYSEWARLDPRYPIAAAVVMFVVAAVLEWQGSSGASNTLALYSFAVFLGGFALVLLRQIRTARARAGPAPSVAGREVARDEPRPRQVAAEQALDRLE